jgi:vacuolar protein sorting-associated protein 11
MSHLALGLGDGTVLLYRHIDNSLSNANAGLTVFPKPKTVHESPTEPITGLGFREPFVDDAGAQHPLHLFVVTTNRVLSYPASGKGGADVVDEVGAGLGCAVMDRMAREIVVAREEAIYLCGTEGRGNCYAYEGMPPIPSIPYFELLTTFEGPKVSVHTHLHYLIIVSPPLSAVPSSASATVRRFAMRAPEPVPEVTKVTLFDLENKFVALTHPFVGGVRSVVSTFGSIYVLSNSGQV